ncbi:Rv0909 family putative TA system antitoxin [Arthrobacter agilis]|nr:Rv0909 family putative TA system antitoxin [Arthrobacter agilis]
MADKAKDYAQDNPEKVDQAKDKAKDAVDGKDGDQK